MAIVKSKWAEMLRPGMDAIWKSCWYEEWYWYEEIKAGDRKVIAQVLEEAIPILEAFDAHPTCA